MLEILRQDRSPTVPFDRSGDGRVSQHPTYSRLFVLHEEPRHHAVYGSNQRLSANLPAIGRTPLAVVDMGAAEWSPHVAARDIHAAVEKYLVGTGCRELRIDVNALLGNHLERAFTFYKAGEPRPLSIGCHADEYNTLNPTYAAIAERRIRKESPMFADVVAA